MSLYLPPQNFKGSIAIAVCDRCGFKKRYGDLRMDTDAGLMVCDNCMDEPDPYKLPARKTEKTSLQRPRPDAELE